MQTTQKDPYLHFSEEELFRLISRHLFAQGEPSRSKDSEGTTSNVCLYRGPNNTKCAVGFLIPDSSYKENMEGHGIDSLLQSFPNDLPEVLWKNRELLSRLQSIHDGYSTSSKISFNSHLLGQLCALAGERAFNVHVLIESYSRSIKEG